MDFLEIILKMGKITSMIGLSGLVFKVGKWVYDRNEKEKASDFQKNKKLIINVMSRTILLGWEPSKYDTISFSVEMFNPKNYSIQIQQIKLMESIDSKIIERDSQIPFKQIIIKSDDKEKLGPIFNSLISSIEGKNWFIRVIDNEDNYHDSKIIDLTSQSPLPHLFL